MAFPLAARGYQEVIGFDIETHPDNVGATAYGTVIDPVTKFLRVLRCDINPVDPGLARPSPSGAPVAKYYGTGSTTLREYQGVPDIRGTIEAELDADLFPFFLGNAMRSHGDSNQTIPLYTKSGAGDPYTHTFKYPTIPSAGPQALTVQRQTGRRHSTFGGGMIESLEIACDGGLVTWTAGMVFQNYADNVSADTVSFTDSPVFRMHESKLYIDTAYAAGATIVEATDLRTNIKNWTLSITNPLRVEASSGVADSSGSCSSGRGIRRPILMGPAVIRLAIGTDYDTEFYQDMMRVVGTGAYTALELQITPDSDANHIYEFRMPAAHCEGNFPTYGGGDGPVPEEVIFEAATFDTGAALEIFQCIAKTAQSGDYCTIGAF